jgi:hypothetical protein
LATPISFLTWLTTMYFQKMHNLSDFGNWQKDTKLENKD